MFYARKKVADPRGLRAELHLMQRDLRFIRCAQTYQNPFDVLRRINHE